MAQGSLSLGRRASSGYEILWSFLLCLIIGLKCHRILHIKIHFFRRCTGQKRKKSHFPEIVHWGLICMPVSFTMCPHTLLFGTPFSCYPVHPASIPPVQVSQGLLSRRVLSQVVPAVPLAFTCGAGIGASAHQDISVRNLETSGAWHTGEMDSTLASIHCYPKSYRQAAL